MNQALFSSLDYSLLLAYLIVVVGIGVWVGRGQEDTKDYFLAGRSMGWFPIGISTIASLYSAISYMGSPSEYRTHDLRLTVGHAVHDPHGCGGDVRLYAFLPPAPSLYRL